MTRAVVGITMGDPAGIGPEIALKAAVDPRLSSRCLPVIIGSVAVLDRVREVLDLDLQFRRYFPGKDAAPNPGARAGDSANGVQAPVVHIVDLDNCRPGEFAFGAVSATMGRAAYEYIERAIAMALKGEIDAVATGPIHKESLNLSGIPHPGHTEIFASLTGTAEYAMMLAVDDLRISHVTTHVALAQVPSLVTKERVLSVIRLTHDAVAALGVKAPRIAVAGLNPHCGEGGLFGSEDEREIRPAVAAARHSGIDASGPLPGDTVFVQARAGRFDAVVAMYHDQGHIPAKLAGFKVDPQSGTWRAVTGVNITLGLPIIRTSVDHGVAFDIAGKGIASHDSMVDAVNLAAQLALGRA